MMANDPGTRLPAGAKPVRMIPVLGQVPAGIPEVKEQDIIDYVALPDAPDNSFALVVQGESMTGSNIQHGDYVIFVPKADIKPGDVVVALNEFNAAMVKQYMLKDGQPWLISTNPAFPSFQVNGAYRVVGKVVDVVRRIKV
ncbi:MAG: hypothetical protein HUU10_15485 [Bacteroidetes bacterium]|nr:hypothetical protein [Bacteroidota bacterium]